MNRRKSGFRYLFVILLIGFCLLSAGMIWAAVQIPQQTVKRFGVPAHDLSWKSQLIYSTQLLYYENDLAGPGQNNNSSTPFHIDLSEPIVSISNRLESAGVIRNAHAFEVYLAYSGLDTTIQAGEYVLEPGMNAIQVALRLQDATPSEIDFAILAGWRLEEIAASIPTSGLEFTPQFFLQKAQAGVEVHFDWLEDGSLEGYLLPGVYHIPRTAVIEELFKVILQEFDLSITPRLAQNFEQQGLSLREAVILASIVEKEAIIAEEQPLVASVFLNRLNAGMLLESDPTVQYALGYDAAGQSWWKNPLTLDDLNYDSPYNTYLYGGLPSGPICNPGLSALEAVAYPADTPYYYFRAACDGSGRHLFATTYEEHLANACQP